MEPTLEMRVAHLESTIARMSMDLAAHKATAHVQEMPSPGDLRHLAGGIVAEWRAPEDPAEHVREPIPGRPASPMEIKLHAGELVTSMRPFVILYRGEPMGCVQSVTDMYEKLGMMLDGYGRFEIEPCFDESHHWVDQ